MNKTIKALLLTVLVAGTACTTQAQSEEEGKIKIKITRKIDGEMKTFEGEYASEEEMRNDPAYREFAGEEDDFTFSFDEDEMMKAFRLHKAPGAHVYSFSFDDEDFVPHRMLKDFHFKQGAPRAFWFGDEDAVHMRSFDHEAYEKEMEEKMKALEEKMKGLDKDLQEEIMKTMREIEEMNASMMRPKWHGGVRIEDAGEDFGKRGVVSEADKLDLKDVNYMVMNKRLRLRFRVPAEGELTVKISNEAGKDIYNRYFEKFGGTFSDEVDFEKYSSGKYLLEISQGKKRLTKKIVID